MPGMTAGDAVERQPKTFDNTIFLERLLGITRTRRRKPAGGWQDNSQRKLIDANQRPEHGDDGAAEPGATCRRRPVRVGVRHARRAVHVVKSTTRSDQGALQRAGRAISTSQTEGGHR